MRAVNPWAPVTCAKSDRRWSRRRPLVSAANLLIALRRPLSYQTQDIGEDGMSIVGPISLVLGTRGVVRFMLPTRSRDEACIELATIVVNRRPAGDGYRLGLQYAGLDPDSRDLILKFLGTVAQPLEIRRQFESA